MNEHILHGKWKQIRGGFKKQWGKLTDDDLKRIQGSLDQITGILEQRYGYSKDRAERELEHYVDDIHQYSARLKGYGGDIQSKVHEAVSEVKGKVQRKPKRKKRSGFTAVLAIFALVGVVIYMFNQQDKSSSSSNG